MKISIGFIFSGPESLQNLLLEVGNFVQELLQRTRIEITKILAIDDRYRY